MWRTDIREDKVDESIIYKPQQEKQNENRTKTNILSAPKKEWLW